ncbi:hypothetical protein [Tunicatimonas pelagia]|uniref:hypothetical protein n=1 Tax=Tunicatimonas pelagia TaxID=931531 RepID=UPI0026657C0E|nr:hypothetical protein [Tunicatimonas pelagia]WKN45373.1 hypothetical protein P0M28_10435 [Tunicatimonas pelagia]
MLRPILYGFILILSSWPSLLIEVFTRRKFGERHFSVGSCLTAVGIMLFFMVFVPDWQVPLLRDLGYSVQYSDVRGWTVSKVLIVMYGIAVMLISLYHKYDILKKGQTMNSERYSKSEGIAFLYWYRLFGRLPTWVREWCPMDEMTLRRYYEPITAFLIGLVFFLIPFTTMFGFVIMICGGLYFWRSYVKYALGYHAMLDMMDDMILAEELEDVITEDEPVGDHRGVFVLAPKPNNPNLREDLYEAMRQELNLTKPSGEPQLI